MENNRNRNFKVLFVYLIFLAISMFLTYLSGKSTGDYKFLFSIASFTPILIGFLLIIIYRYPGGLNAIYLRKENALKNYFIGIMFGILQFVAFSLISKLLGINSIDIGKRPINWGIIAMFGIGFVGQTALEEVFCRGVFLNFFGRKFNMLIAVLISSFLFSALHIPNGGTTILSLTNIFLIGVFFCLLTIKTKSLFTACGAHFGWNFFESNIFTAHNSNKIVENGIYKLRPIVNTEYLTGGGFGPEASIITTFILIVSILFCIYLMKDDLKQFSEKIDQ